MATNGNALINAISEDHKDVYNYYDQYVKNTGNAHAQARWARQLIWEVARHMVGEEIVVYPLMEKHLGVPGHRCADEDRAVHQKVKKLLYDIESHTPGSQQHAAKLKSVMEILRPHHTDEVERDLPLLTRAIGEEASAKAAASFKKTMNFAPTRAHPDAPNKPPFVTVVAFLESRIDKLKDMFAKFPEASELSSGNTQNALISAITKDHQEIYTHYGHYVGSKGNVEAQGSWSRHLIWDIARHTVGEELVVHPLMVHHLGVVGQRLASDEHSVHEKVRELLYKTESHTPDSPEHAAILNSVIEHLRLHTDDEEQRDLPILTNVMGARACADAVVDFEKTKKFSPYAYPEDAANRPPFNTFFALMEAPVAKLNEIFATF